MPSDTDEPEHLRYKTWNVESRCLSAAGYVQREAPAVVPNFEEAKKLPRLRHPLPKEIHVDPSASPL
jgi:hypothetical protein